MRCHQALLSSALAKALDMNNFGTVSFAMAGEPKQPAPVRYGW